MEIIGRTTNGRNIVILSDDELEYRNQLIKKERNTEFMDKWRTYAFIIPMRIYGSIMRCSLDDYSWTIKTWGEFIDDLKNNGIRLRLYRNVGKKTIKWLQDYFIDKGN